MRLRTLGTSNGIRQNLKNAHVIVKKNYYPVDVIVHLCAMISPNSRDIGAEIILELQL